MGEVEINDSWSLTAVVRECARKARLRAQLTVDTPQTNTTPITTNNSPLGSSNNSYSPKQNFDQFVLENNSASFMLPSAAGATTAAPPADRCTSRDELINEMTYKPFLSKNNSMVEATNHLIPPNPQQQLQIRNLNKRQGSSDIGHHFIEKRNRKYEDRRVVKCSLEELSKNEKWAWRKYGQKPIKGSPYPRNYYRCSTMKGCKARKQVERSPVDPNIYIVTYTSYHLHPYPNLRSYHGPRAKPRGSDPDPTLESESPFNTDPGQYGSGSGSGSGCEKVRIEEELDDSDEGGGGDESFGCGGMMDGRNNNEDEILMIAKTTADSDLLTGMEQFCGGEKISAGSSNSNSNSNDYNKNVGFDEMIINYGSESRMNNEEVQMEDNKWLENDINNNGVGIRDMYASAPATLAGAHETPSSVGNNIWDSGIIKPQFYSF